MTRLLQAMAGAPLGGAENFFTRLTLALQHAGQDQRVMIRADAARESLLRNAGVNVLTAPFGSRLDLKTGRAFKRAIAEYRPDIVLSWMNRATSFCPKPQGRFVHIGTPRGYYAPKYYAACDHLVVTTDDLVKFYTDAGWPADRIDCIPNFVPASEPAAPTPRAQFDTPEGVPLLLALGRLHPNKGFDVLIRALAKLPDHYLWIGGSGPEEAALRRLADEVGVTPRLRLLGWQADTAPLFAAADAFICSSRHEPFGNIVVESWVHGAPILAAASEGPGVLITEGESGLLVPVEDSDALAAAIRRLVDEPGLSERLAEGGRAAWAAGYTEEIVTGRYRALFERLAG